MQKQPKDKNHQLLLQLLIMSLQKQQSQSRVIPQDRKRLREDLPTAIGTECFHRQKRHRSITREFNAIPSSALLLQSVPHVAEELKIKNDRVARLELERVSLLRKMPLDGNGVKIIKMLMKVGAEGIVDALSCACREGNASVVKYLLKHHTLCLVDTPCRIDFVQGLLLKGAASGTNSSDVIDVSRCVGWTHLHTACYLGHYEIAKILLKNKADVKAMTGNRWTPLHCACYQGHRDIVGLLLEYDSYGKTTATGTRTKESTPLHCACHKGHLDIVKLLLEKDAGDMSASTSHGWTPLHCACHHGYFEIVKVLLAKGADVSATNAKGSKPFHCAFDNGHLGVAALLVETKEAHR